MATGAASAPHQLAPGTVANLRGSSLLLAGRMTALLVNGLTQVLIVRYLTKSDFGAFAFAMSVAAIGHRIASLGHGQVTGRYLALYLQQRDEARFLGVLVLAAGCIASLTAVLFLGLGIFRGTLSAVAPPDPLVLSLVLILFVLAATDTLINLLENAFAVFGRPGSIFIRKYVMTPGALLIVSVAVMVLKGSVTALAVGYVVVGIAGVILYLTLLIPLLRSNLRLERLRDARVVLPTRQVFGMGLPLVSTEVFNVVTNNMGVVVLGVIAGTTGVADLRAIFPIAAMNQIVIYTFTTLFVPLLMRLHGHGDLTGVRTAYWQTASWLAVLSFPVFALTGPFANAVTVALFGQRYAASSVALALLSIGFYVNALFGFNTATLIVFGRVRRLVVIDLICAAANVALYFMLIPLAGATGVATACCITYVLRNVLTQQGLRSTIGVPFLDPQFARLAASIVVASAAAAAIAVLATPDLWLAIPLAGLGFVLVLIVNRRRLQVDEAFPELRRVPGVRRLLA